MRMLFSRKKPKEPVLKVAVVTGASRGIGRGIVLALAKKGYSLAINHSKSSDQAKRVARDVGTDQKAIVIKADVSKRGQVDFLVKKTLQEFGRIDVLVNNAGTVFEPAGWQEVSEVDFRRTWEVGLTGTFNCIRKIAPVMLGQKFGKIVNISSLAGITPGKAGAPAYAAAKAGMINLTQAFAKELAPDVNVNAVAPSWVKTDWHRYKKKNFFKMVEEKTPMGRMAEIKDVVNAVLFLVSDKASFITGQTLIIDGGLSLG